MKNYNIIPNKKFEEYDSYLKENKYFLQDYFSTIESNAKEYKFIPKECLDDKYFVFSCLLKNPDIYLLADNVHSLDMFEYLKEKKRNNYLKYASKEQLEDRVFCLKAIEETPYNYPYLPKELKEDKRIVEQAFTRSFSPGDLSSSIPIKVIRDREFMISLMKKNNEVFLGVKKHFKKDKEIMKMLVLSRSYFFADTDIELKSDKDWVNSIFEQNKINKQDYSYRSVFNYGDIILELPNNYFSDEKFIRKNLDEVIKSYCELSKEKRSNITLMRQFFSEETLGNNPHMLDTLLEGRIIKKIPIEELKQKLLVSLATNKGWYGPNDVEKSNDFKKLIRTVDYFMLSEELRANGNQEHAPKKLKI